MNNLKFSTKLVAYFLFIGILSVVSVGLISFNTSRNALLKRTMEQLTSIKEIKKSQIETFFGERIGDIMVLADNPTTVQSTIEFNAAAEGAKERGFHGLNILNDEVYAKTLAELESTLKFYMETYDYYDLFLIDNDGNITYTVAKESDVFTDLSQEKTHLADLYKECMSTNRAVLSDMEKYAPSNDAPALFVAAPVKNNNKTIGVVALQISNDAINAIMQQQAGLGESGETYLVGSDFLLRSDSRFSTESTILLQKAETEGSKEALNGTTDTKIFDDYRGIAVLSSYAKLNLPGIDWAILAEIDEEETLLPVIAMGKVILIVSVVMLLIPKLSDS